MNLPFKPALPWLLYAYPWMPYPRRVIIYLREKDIPETLIRVAQVSDPQNGNQVVDSSLPPRPSGSLTVLAIPSEAKGNNGTAKECIHIRQSMAIINYLEELCNSNQYGFSSPYGSLVGESALAKTRICEVLTLAKECTVAW